MMFGCGDDVAPLLGAAVAIKDHLTEWLPPLVHESTCFIWRTL
jgi:hypothetical protein